MSYNTIIRSFNQDNMYLAAQMHNRKTLYTLKYIGYLLITLFIGQNLIKLREIRRQEEIDEVATNILNKLPSNFDDLTNKEFVCYQNKDKNYQITYNNKRLYLSKIDDIDRQSTRVLMEINTTSKYNELKSRLYQIKIEKKYDELSKIKLQNMVLIDKLPQLRISTYQRHNQINQVIDYFTNIYTNQQVDKISPWGEKNISMIEYAMEFKNKFDYFIKNRYNSNYNPNKYPIAGDDIYELTGYFLYYNPNIKQQLLDINLYDHKIMNSIFDMIGLDDDIRMSNMQCICANLT